MAWLLYLTIHNLMNTIPQHFVLLYKEAQSFTLLNADICIDINGDFCFEQVSWLNRTERRALLRFGKVNSKENICTFSLLLIWVNVPSLNIAIPSRKCFIKVQPANKIKSPIYYWRKTVFNEVNNLAQNQLIHKNKKVQINLILKKKKSKWFKYDCNFWV